MEGISINRAAETTGLDKSYLRQLVRQGTIAMAGKDGQRILVDEVSLRAYVNRNNKTAPEETAAAR